MTGPEATPRGSRETRLLLVTIAVSVGVLLLLARFRFPEQGAGRGTESAPAPLERLAARAAYDELAGSMADLERRVAPRLTVVRAQSPDGATSMSIAARMLPDRAVTVLQPGGTILGGPDSGQELMGLDTRSGAAVVRVPAVEDSAVSLRQAPLRSGPRYLALAEPSTIGPVLRPVYVGRIDTIEDPRTGTPLLAFAGLQPDVPAGAALFALDGTFLGLIRDTGETATVIPGDQLRAAAEKTQPGSATLRGDLGVDVDALTAALARATGAEQGAIVTHVRPGGPAASALRPGDVVQSIDGQPVVSEASFRELERSRKPGDNVELTAIRARAPVTVTITAADVAAPAAAAQDSGIVGRTVNGVGFEVVTVRDGSAAAHADLRRGDLVLSADGETAPEAAAFERRFRSAPSGTSIIVTVQRGGEHRALAIEKR